MQMSKTAFWIITILWFLAGIFWYRSCSTCTSCGNQAAAAGVGAGEMDLPAFTISDGSWSLSSPVNFRFSASSATPVISDEMSGLLDSIVAHAKNFPGKMINLTGLYGSHEKNNTSYPDLGIARAQEMKSVLVSRGLDSTLITTRGELSDALTFHPADTLVGGVNIFFAPPKDIDQPEQPSEPSQPSPPVDDELFKPRTVYFHTGQGDLTAEDALLQYIRQVKDYMDTHQENKLILRGYADNVGDDEANQLLSAKRAEAVKNILTAHGISANRIDTQGLGENDPVGDNNTTDGRSKNRRVTIQLQ